MSSWITRRANESREVAGYSNAHRRSLQEAFLHARKVPSVERTSCTCGWRQDVKRCICLTLAPRERVDGGYWRP